MHQISTSEQFYDEDEFTRHYNYVVSKHEVGEWYDRIGIEGLHELIERVKAKEKFFSCIL